MYTIMDEEATIISPPALVHHSISIRQILDDYYEGGSFGSEGMNAIDAADSFLAGIDRIPSGLHRNDSKDVDKGCGDVARIGFDGKYRNDREGQEISIQNASSESIMTRFENMATRMNKKKDEDPWNQGDCKFIVKEEERFNIHSNASLPRPMSMSQENELLVSKSKYNAPVHAHESAPMSADHRLVDDDVAPRSTNIIPQGWNDNDSSSLREEQAHTIDHFPSSYPDRRLPTAERNVQGGLPTNQPQPPSGPSKAKKPFLRRGTRREPSALHRVNKPRQSTTALNHSTSDNSDKSNNLEHLERMQQQQMENLKKRIDLRQNAREDIIRRHKKGCNVQVGDQGSIEKKVGQKCSEEDECSDDEDGEDNEEVTSDAYSSFDEPDDDDDSEDEDEDEQELKTVQKKTLCKRRVVGKKTPVRSPLKPLNKANGASNASSSKGFQTPEMEEQWQVIKSMRRRQEAALRAAEKDREEVSLNAAYLRYVVDMASNACH